MQNERISFSVAVTKSSQLWFCKDVFCKPSEAWVRRRQSSSDSLGIGECGIRRKEGVALIPLFRNSAPVQRDSGFSKPFDEIRHSDETEMGRSRKGSEAGLKTRLHQSG
jgi:hypothetical protein